MGSITGCDFCGEIVESKSDRPVGQRVAGWVHGNKFPDRGTYAEYAKADSDRVFTLPESIGSDEAATFGIGFVTAAMVSERSELV